MKKILAVLFCALIMMASFSVFASAADVPAASVNTADSTDISSIFASLSELFTGNTDISKLVTSMTELFGTFFGTLGDIIDWSAVGSSLWTGLKNMFTDISTTFQYLFAEIYGG